MIREEIRELMALTGMSQAELGRRACIPQPNISDFLNEKSDVNTETASRMLAVLREEAERLEGLE